MTTYLALTELARFQPGGTVLAPGSGGAVGKGSVEIARHLGASLAIITATATSTAKAERSRAAGYEVIDLSRESLRDGVARLTDGKDVDVVLDGVAGPITRQALGAIARGGTLLSIGYSAGMEVMHERHRRDLEGGSPARLPVRPGADQRGQRQGP